MKNFKNILCMATTKAALDYIVTLAENNQARLTVVDVVENIKSSDQQTDIMRARAQEMAILVDPYKKRIPVQTKVLKGMPFKEIIREVMHNGHDLLIKSPDWSVLFDRLFYSTDTHLLRKCPCPIFFIRPTPERSCQLILAAVDVDDTHPSTEIAYRHALNQRIFETATSLALSNSAELHIVHAWHAVGESAMRSGFICTREEKVIAYVEQLRRQHAAHLDEFVQEMLSNLAQNFSHHLQPQTHLMKGSAHKEIPALAKRIEADLVVMGTAARTGVSGFTIGNTAEVILNQIDCSILVITPPSLQPSKVYRQAQE